MQQINDKSNQESSETSLSFSEKIAEFKHKRTLHPFIIVVLLFLIVECTGVLAMNQYIVQIFKAFNSPISPDKATALLSFSMHLSVLYLCAPLNSLLTVVFSFFFSYKQPTFWLTFSSFPSFILPAKEFYT